MDLGLIAPRRDSQVNGVMGTSTRMIERQYGTLIAGAGEGIAATLESELSARRYFAGCLSDGR